MVTHCNHTGLNPWRFSRLCFDAPQQGPGENQKTEPDDIQKVRQEILKAQKLTLPETMKKLEGMYESEKKLAGKRIGERLSVVENLRKIKQSVTPGLREKLRVEELLKNILLELKQSLHHQITDLQSQANATGSLDQKKSIERQIQSKQSYRAMVERVEKMGTNLQEKDIAEIKEALLYQDERLNLVARAFADAAVAARFKDIDAGVPQVDKSPDRGLLTGVFKATHNDELLDTHAIYSALEGLSKRSTQRDLNELLKQLEGLHVLAEGPRLLERSAIQSQLVSLFLERNLSTLGSFEDANSLAGAIVENFNLFLNDLAIQSPNLRDQLASLRFETNTRNHADVTHLAEGILNELLGKGKSTLELKDNGAQRIERASRAIENYRNEKDPAKRADLEKAYLENLRTVLGSALWNRKAESEWLKAIQMDGRDEAVASIEATNLPASTKSGLTSAIKGRFEMVRNNHLLSTRPPLEMMGAAGNLGFVRDMAARIPTLREFDKGFMKYLGLGAIVGWGSITAAINLFSPGLDAFNAIIVPIITLKPWKILTEGPGQLKKIPGKIFGSNGLMAALALAAAGAGANPDAARRIINGAIEGVKTTVHAAGDSEIGSTLKRGASWTYEKLSAGAQLAMEGIQNLSKVAQLTLPMVSDFFLNYGNPLEWAGELGEQIKIQANLLKENHDLGYQTVETLRPENCPENKKTFAPILHKLNELAMEYGNQESGTYKPIPQKEFMLALGLSATDLDHPSIMLKFAEVGNPLINPVQNLQEYLQMESTSPTADTRPFHKSPKELWNGLNAKDVFDGQPKEMTAKEIANHLGRDGKMNKLMKHLKTDTYYDFMGKDWETQNDWIITAAQTYYYDSHQLEKLQKEVQGYEYIGSLGQPNLTEVSKKEKDPAKRILLKARELLRYKAIIDLIKNTSKPNLSPEKKEACLDPAKYGSFYKNLTGLRTFILQKRAGATSWVDELSGMLK